MAAKTQINNRKNNTNVTSMITYGCYMNVKVTAKAWTDSSFKSSLLSSSDSTIHSECPYYSNTMTFSVTEDAGSARNLALPFKKSEYSNYTAQQLLDILIAETDNSTNLLLCLPAVVIRDAFIDSSFKSQLLSNPTSILSNLGYNVNGCTYNILENTSTLYNQVLRKNPDPNASYSTLLAGLYADFGIDANIAGRS